MPYFDRGRRSTAGSTGMWGMLAVQSFGQRRSGQQGLDIPNLDIKLDYEIEEVGQATADI